jgi:CelD/BcsL family acetyltransferase involved in cellulose biosynthesis
MDYQNYNTITKSPIKTFLSQQVEKAVQQGLRVELVKDEKSFLHLQGEWNNLLTNSTANNIFLTWEWISTWWKIYKENFELYLITVRDKEANLVGIGPFKVTKRKFLRLRDISVLEFLGSGVGATPEFLEIVVKNGYEEGVLPLIVSTIIMDETIDMIDLHPYSTNARSREFLETIFKAEKLTSCVVPHSLSPVVHLPQTWDEYFQKKSRNFRKKMKEYRNRCARELKVVIGKANTSTGALQCLDSIIELHHGQRKNTSFSFKDERSISFHRQLVGPLWEKGWLSNYFMVSSNEMLAGMYCLKYNGTHYYYQSGRTTKYPKHHLGYVLINNILGDAIEEGSIIFNFLTGTEAYKFHWADSCQHSSRLLSLTKEGMASLWLRSYFIVTSALKQKTYPFKMDAESLGL